MVRHERVTYDRKVWDIYSDSGIPELDTEAIMLLDEVKIMRGSSNIFARTGEFRLPSTYSEDSLGNVHVRKTGEEENPKEHPIVGEVMRIAMVKELELRRPEAQWCRVIARGSGHVDTGLLVLKGGKIRLDSDVYFYAPPDERIYLKADNELRILDLKVSEAMSNYFRIGGHHIYFNPW